MDWNSRDNGVATETPTLVATLTLWPLRKRLAFARILPISIHKVRVEHPHASWSFAFKCHCHLASPLVWDWDWDLYSDWYWDWDWMRWRSRLQHFLFPFGFSFLCQPCWPAHDFCRLASAFVCFTAARFDWKIMHLPWQWAPPNFASDTS